MSAELRPSHPFAVHQALHKAVYSAWKPEQLVSILASFQHNKMHACVRVLSTLMRCVQGPPPVWSPTRTIMQQSNMLGLVKEAKVNRWQQLSCTLASVLAAPPLACCNHLVGAAGSCAATPLGWGHRQRSGCAARVLLQPARAVLADPAAQAADFL